MKNVGIASKGHSRPKARVVTRSCGAKEIRPRVRSDHRHPPSRTASSIKRTVVIRSREQKTDVVDNKVKTRARQQKGDTVEDVGGLLTSPEPDRRFGHTNGRAPRPLAERKYS
jgi:hypothetical protein